MQSTIKRLVLIYTAISLVFFLGILWLVDFSHVDLPDNAFGYKIRPYGLLMLLAFVIVFLLLQKRILRYKASSSILELVGTSLAVSLLSLFLYQLIRQYLVIGASFPAEMGYILLSSLVPSIVSGFIAAMIAVELKKIKGVWKHIPLVALLLLFLLFKQYLSAIEW